MAKKKTNKKMNKWVRIVLWILGTVLVFYFIYLVWPFVFWKRYVHERYGYSVMYPPTWHISNQGYGEDPVMISADPKLSIQDPVSDGLPGFFVGSVVKKDGERNIESTIDFYKKPNIGYVKIKKLQLSGSEAVRVHFIKIEDFLGYKYIDFIEELDVQREQLYFNFNGSLACEWNCKLNLRNIIHFLSIRRMVDSVGFEKPR